MASLGYTPGFFSALASTAAFISRPITAPDYFGSSFLTEGSRKLLGDSFSQGLLPDRSLSSMIGDILPSRSFLRFGPLSSFLGQPSGTLGMPDFVTPFLTGGFGMLSPGQGMPGGFVPPPVAPPQFKQAHLPTSAPQAPATSINLRTGRDDEVEGAADAITPEVIDKVVTKLGDANYSQEEAAEIVAKAGDAAEGNRGRFLSIVSRVPPKPKSDLSDDEFAEAKKNWHKKFGDWYAHHIQGLDNVDPKEREAYVERVAFTPGTSEGETLQVVRDRKSPGSHAGWRITNDPVFGGFAKKQYVYSKGGKWYSDKECRQEISDVTVSGGGTKRTLTFPPSEGDSYATLDYEKVEDGYEVYQAKSSEGKTYKMYRDRDGKWYEKKGAAYELLKGKHDPIDRRFYSNRAPREPFKGLYDVRRYMERMVHGYEGYKKHLEASEKLREKTYADRVEAFRKQVVEALPAGLRDKFKVVKGESADPIGITIDKADAPAFAKAFAATTGERVDKKKFDAAFRLLPKGALFEFNDYVIDLRNDPHGAIGREVGGLLPPEAPAEEKKEAEPKDAATKAEEKDKSEPAPKEVSAGEGAMPKDDDVEEVELGIDLSEPVEHPSNVADKLAPQVAPAPKAPKTGENVVSAKNPPPTVAELKQGKVDRRPNEGEELISDLKNRFKDAQKQGRGLDQDQLDQQLSDLKGRKNNAVSAAEEHFERRRSPEDRGKTTPTSMGTKKADQPSGVKEELPGDIRGIAARVGEEVRQETQATELDQQLDGLADSNVHEISWQGRGLRDNIRSSHSLEISDSFPAGVTQARAPAPRKYEPKPATIELPDLEHRPASPDVKTRPKREFSPEPVGGRSDSGMKLYTPDAFKKRLESTNGRDDLPDRFAMLYGDKRVGRVKRLYESIKKRGFKMSGKSVTVYFIDTSKSKDFSFAKHFKGRLRIYRGVKKDGPPLFGCTLNAFNFTNDHVPNAQKFWNAKQVRYAPKGKAKRKA